MTELQDYCHLWFILQLVTPHLREGFEVAKISRQKDLIISRQSKREVTAFTRLLYLIKVRANQIGPVFRTRMIIKLDIVKETTLVTHKRWGDFRISGTVGDIFRLMMSSREGSVWKF
jgi:hypothetical protein